LTNSFREIFKLQDEIVQSLIATVGLQLAMLNRRYVFPQRTDNLEAYDDFLRGIEFFGFGNPTKETNEQARQMFQKAIEFDPKYSDAYALLGYVQYMDVISSVEPRPSRFRSGYTTGATKYCSRQLQCVSLRTP
jgi:hypothetical protein